MPKVIVDCSQPSIDRLLFDFLKEIGFLPAPYGMREKKYRAPIGSLDVLIKGSAIKAVGLQKIFNCFANRIPDINRRILFCTIILRDKDEIVSENEWLLDIYGKDNISIAEKLADDLEKRFGISITLRLISQECKREELYSDYGL